jgi:fibronectin type 3 domain-containing protein
MMKSKFYVGILCLMVWGVGCSKLADNKESAVIKAPVNVMASGLASVVNSVSSEKILVVWQGSVDEQVAGYFVYRLAGVEKDFTVCSGVLKVNQYEDLDVSFNITYKYKVTAIDVDGNESDFSTVCTACITDEDAPAVIDVPEVVSITDKLVVLNWTKGLAADLVGYSIYRSETEVGGYQKISSEIVVSNNYQDNTIDMNKTYYYKISAMDKAGNEGVLSAFCMANTDIEAPAAAGKPSVVGVDINEVSLSWTVSDSEDLLGYNVYRCKTEAGEYEKINLELISVNNYKDVAVENNTKYFYKIAAVDEAGNESVLSENNSGFYFYNAPMTTIDINDNFEIQFIEHANHIVTPDVAISIGFDVFTDRNGLEVIKQRMWDKDGEEVVNNDQEYMTLKSDGLYAFKYNEQTTTMDRYEQRVPFPFEVGEEEDVTSTHNITTKRSYELVDVPAGTFYCARYETCSTREREDGYHDENGDWVETESYEKRQISIFYVHPETMYVYVHQKEYKDDVLNSDKEYILQSISAR